MNKQDYLEVLELLAALESWGFSTKERFPDYIVEKIISVMEKVRGEILAEKGYPDDLYSYSLGVNACIKMIGASHPECDREVLIGDIRSQLLS